MRRKILWSAVITVFNLLALEVGLRLSGIGVYSQTIPDERLGWRNLPNQTCPAMRGGTVHINAHGMRDEDFPREKPAGEFRVLVLGDSVTYGVTIGQDNIFCHLLNDALRRPPDRPAVRFMNAGVAGYDVNQYRVYLKEQGFSLSPDVVMVVFNQNDILFNPEESAIRPFRGRALLQRTAIFVAADRLYRSFKVKTAHAKSKRDPLRHLMAEYAGGDPIDVTLPVHERQLEVARRILLEMNEVCRRNGARFAIVGLPRNREVAEYAAISKRRVNPAFLQNKLTTTGMLATLREFSKANSIPYTDLLKALAAVHPQCWLPDGGHFTVEGHAAVAEALLAFLSEQRLVPDGPRDR